MDRNLPATRAETLPAETVPDDEARFAPLPAQPRVSVAFLPFALVVFIIVALTMAAWTFLSTAV